MPLCYVLCLFESVVEGTLRFGRWLYAVQPGAEEILDSLYQTWARSLLGAASWRNWAVAFSELGWVMTGSGRAVVDVAMKRCTLFLLDPHDIYRRAFVLGHSVEGMTWSKLSLAMLKNGECRIGLLGMVDVVLGWLIRGMSKRLWDSGVYVSGICRWSPTCFRFHI